MGMMGTMGTSWKLASESSFDIRALRQMALDGPLAVDAGSQELLATSLSTAMVKSDDQGNTRLVKRSNNNTSRPTR